MWKFNVHARGLVCAALMAAIWASAAAPLWAASNIIVPKPGYLATDGHATMTVRSHDAWGSLLAVYDGGAGLKVFDRTSGQQYDLGTSGADGDSWNSFVTFSPNGNSIWVGYDYRIYEVTNIRGTPVWNHRADMWYNFDLAFSGNTPYVSGVNTDGYGPNAIWRLDTSGQNLHTNIASVGGFSAGIAFDTAGNLYYGTNQGASEKLVRYSSAQVAAGGLSLSDAERLSDVPYPVYDTDVDASGHVVFDFSEGGFADGAWTQLSSTLAVWDGTVAPGHNYDVIGTAGKDHWFTFLNAEGNVVNGNGTIYLADGAWNPPCPGLAEIRPVPEPSTLVLALSGLAALALWRCNRRQRANNSRRLTAGGEAAKQL